MDISEDGGTLLVGTYAGMLHLLEIKLDYGNDKGISKETVKELKRWIAWKNETSILQW